MGIRARTNQPPLWKRGDRVVLAAPLLIYDPMQMLKPVEAVRVGSLGVVLNRDAYSVQVRFDGYDAGSKYVVFEGDLRRAPEGPMRFLEGQRVITREVVRGDTPACTLGIVREAPADYPRTSRNDYVAVQFDGRRFNVWVAADKLALAPEGA